jgi:hypothetical protein
MTNSNCIILKDTTELLMNDINMKPPWIHHPAQNTEFHIKRGKKELLIVIGESWTYGETLPGIATGIQRYNLYAQLEHCFGPKMAMTMGTDYYQYAVPGNCNLFMFNEVDRILAHVAPMGYEKIYLCLQMTEPGREHAIHTKEMLKGHGITELYHMDEKITFNYWLKKYDEVFFEQLNETLKNYPQVDAVVWKNFCRVMTDNRDYNFKIIETSWIQYGGRILGEYLEMPSFYAVGWFAGLREEYYDRIEFDIPQINKELTWIEKSNEFIKANPLHSTHPSAQNHTLWAQFLTRKAGWKDGI